MSKVGHLVGEVNSKQQPEAIEKFYRAIVNAVNRAFVIHIHYRAPFTLTRAYRGE